MYDPENDVTSCQPSSAELYELDSLLIQFSVESAE